MNLLDLETTHPDLVGQWLRNREQHGAFPELMQFS